MSYLLEKLRCGEIFVYVPNSFLSARSSSFFLHFFFHFHGTHFLDDPISRRHCYNTTCWDLRNHQTFILMIRTRTLHFFWQDGGTWQTLNRIKLSLMKVYRRSSSRMCSAQLPQYFYFLAWTTYFGLHLKAKIPVNAKVAKERSLFLIRDCAGEQNPHWVGVTL